MEGQKVVLVTGGTGNQGGAVARNLNQDKKWKVKVLSRNPNSDESQELSKLGIEVLKGDLNNPSSYTNHLKDVYGVFSVQNYIDGIEKEIAQGNQLANTAKLHNIQHFIYSSVSGADLKTGIPHFESKNKIEKHIKQVNIPYTIIRPTSFYENLLNPEVKKRILKGKLVMPLSKDFNQEYISVEDIGRVASQMFAYPSKYLGKTKTIASDSMTMSDLAKLLSQSMNQKVKYEKLPGLITRLVMGKNLYMMFKWLDKNRPTFIKDVSKIQDEFNGLSNMKSWLEKEFS